MGREQSPSRILFSLRAHSVEDLSIYLFNPLERIENLTYLYFLKAYVLGIL